MITRNGNGSVDMTFYSESNDELVLSFEAGCFKTIVKMIDEFLAKGDSVRNPFHAPGNIKPSLILLFGNKPTSFEIEDLENVDWDPTLTISNKGGKVCLGFDERQAREIQNRCKQICEIKRAVKDVQKKVVIQPA